MTQTDSTGTGRRPAWPVLVGCVIAAAVAFLAFPIAPADRSSFLVAALFRAMWAGLVAGLAMRKAPLVWVAGCAAGGALVGAVAIYLGFHAIAAWEVPVAIVLAAGVAAGAHALATAAGPRIAVGCALAIVVAGLAWQIGVVPGPFAAAEKTFLADVAHEPVAEQYHFDGKIYLKTIFLMKRGTPYYRAFSQAVVEDSRYTAPPPLVFNYREPWPARFVALLPGNAGTDAWLVFLALVLVGIIGAYVLASQFVTPGVALLGPMLLVAYYAFPLTSKWFPLIEFWAGALAVWAVVAMLRERWWTAMVLVTACVAMRELMVYLIPVAWLAWAFYPHRRRALGPLVAMTVVPAAVLGYHAVSAPGVLSASRGGVATWLHGSLAGLVASLRFSDRYIVWGKLLMPGLPMAALAGGLQAARTWRKVLLGAVVVVPTVALALLSSGVYGYYWGGIAQPIMLSLVPLVFIVALPSQTYASPDDVTADTESVSLGSESATIPAASQATR